MKIFQRLVDWPMMPEGRLFIPLFLAVFAACLGFSILTTDLPLAAQAPRVNVRWGSDVTPSQRGALEARYRLAEAIYRDDDDTAVTGSYRILDTSAASLRALIEDPAVADTHFIDRDRYRIASEAMESSPLPGFVWMSAAIALPLAWLSAWFGRDRRAGIGALVTRGIPVIPAEVLGFFRVFYAAFLFAALSGRRLSIDPELSAAERSFEWGWVDWLLGRPDLIRALEDGLLALLVIFALGLFARATYALIAVGLTVWTVVMLAPATTNIHVWEVSFLMVLCLLPVPWGAAFSLDETVRRWRGQARVESPAGRRFGFAVWLPGFLLGAVWAGAAYTKVESGFDWILGGAVRYHWVIDAGQAAVDWGLWVASRPWAAVLMSFVGVALEGAFISAAFARTTRMRIVLATAIGVPLLLGFHLFHGVLWWTWWLALVSFILPWQAVFEAFAKRVPTVTCAVNRSSRQDRRRARFWHGLDWFNRIQFVDAAGHADEVAAPPVRAADLVPSIPLLWPALAVLWPMAAFRARRRTRRADARTLHATTRGASPESRGSAAPHGLQPVHAVVVCLVCALMITDLPEGFGRFTSYSNSYASTAEFDERNPVRPIDELWIRHGTPTAERVFEGATRAGRLVDAIWRVRQGEPLLPDHLAGIDELGQMLVQAHGEDGRLVTLVRRSRFFDWDAGRFDSLDEVVATIDMETAASVVTE